MYRERRMIKSFVLHYVFYLQTILSVTSLIQPSHFGGIVNTASILNSPDANMKASGRREIDDVYPPNHIGSGGHSWKKYRTEEKHYVKQFKKYGIIYKTSFLTDTEFNIIKDELSNMPLTLIQETTDSVARNRMGARLPQDCEIFNMLSNPQGSFIKVINEITANEKQQNTKMILSSVVPVEMRTYEKRGAGMEWHHDDVLYEPEQIEVVFTVENTSDCVTMWEETKNDEKSIGHAIKLKQVETEANSAIILRAGLSGSKHSVSSLNHGRRVILKFVFIREGAKFLEGAQQHTNQFISNRSQKRRKRKR